VGWGFIFTCFAIYLGFHLLDLLIAVLQPPSGVASAIESIYALSALAYMAVSLALAVRIIFGRSSTSH